MSIEQLIARTTALETAEELQPHLHDILNRLDRMERLMADMAESSDSVLTTVQVAEMLHCESPTVIRFVREEGLEAVKRGRIWYFRKSRVLAFLTSERGSRLAARMRTSRKTQGAV
ncbi:MAG: helix-turn-helix domain-containing protein [Anaerolineales bacterium]|nr:helix-turn-helix domain-containing protein [Anaerolineales bacterium]